MDEDIRNYDELEIARESGNAFNEYVKIPDQDHHELNSNSSL